MNKATATKIINKSKALEGPESFGFKRYISLPHKTRFNLSVSHFLAGNPDSTFTKTVADFFASMAENEFKEWLLSND